ncbi:unnamed protein product [Owenia fusiformis]|uniref:Gamma-tubulin complex component n=1 Tax=Owenia fusiformis TaxID=6347 RepID=A0A8S4Q226_OWEFU|nr:unnamed protein product [Owenia fusiformis]
MSEHEFTVHHHVSELMTLLGVPTKDGPGPEVYTDILMKSMTPYISTQITTHNAKRKIAESTKKPNEFLQKYDELKARNVKDLDALTYLAAKLCEDASTKSFLEKNAKDRASMTGTTLTPHHLVTSQLPPSGTKMSPQELTELKDKLLKEVSSSSNVQSEVIRKVLKEPKPKNLNIPVQPDWLFRRPYLTMDFVFENDEMLDPGIIPLGNLPVAIQEQAIIEDLLYCLEGVDGKYVYAKPLSDRYGERGFIIEPSVDPSLGALVKRVLPLCANYSTVVRFIEEKSAFEYGLVNHALSAAMRTLIKDYMVLVAQLEHQFKLGQLTMQKLWFYIQPTMRTMEILAAVSYAVNKGQCIGGTILGLLHEKTSSLIGDTKGQEICLYLTQAACVPYFGILEKWIYKGIIADPYSEFLVEEDESFKRENIQEDYNDAYWEQHYTICRDRVPDFLVLVAEKILNCGKYLNVIRKCGRDVACPHAEELTYTIKEKLYVEHIERAHNYASKLLLELLMEEKELMARLRSVKRYFLMDQGDFMVQFMDMAENEMKKPMEEIMPTRLESLLELALRTSTSNIDPFKDDLRVDLLPYDLINQLFKILSIETKVEKDYRMDPTDIHLSGLESFSFDYVVKWPVSLVLNRKALTRYQMLFRHLFYSKHVERQLCNVWLSNKTAKSYTQQSTRWYAAAFALRQRMLNFVQNFMYYMMFEVIEPNWMNFETNLNNVSNIDDVLAFHTDFLNNCLKDCMLTNPNLLKIVHKLMVVCVTFSNFVQRLGKSTDVDTELAKLSQDASRSPRKTTDAETRKATSKVVSDHVDQLASSENFERTINKFDNNFTKLLVQLLDQILDFNMENSDQRLMNMLYRLDFNGFYTEKLESLAMEKSMMESTTMEPPVNPAMGGVHPSFLEKPGFKPGGLRHPGGSS